MEETKDEEGTELAAIDTKVKNNLMFYLGQRMLRVNLILMTVIWVSCSFNYYMISYKVKYFPGSLNVN